MTVWPWEKKMLTWKQTDTKNGVTLQLRRTIEKKPWRLQNPAVFMDNDKLSCPQLRQALDGRVLCVSMRFAPNWRWGTLTLLKAVIQPSSITTRGSPIEFRASLCVFCARTLEAALGSGPVLCLRYVNVHHRYICFLASASGNGN